MARNWDDQKSRLNKRKHRVSFELAWRVFEDPFALTEPDYIDENNELRYQTLGLYEGVLLLVAHVDRLIEENVGEEPWLISARKATKDEAKIYLSNQTKAGNRDIEEDA